MWENYNQKKRSIALLRSCLYPMPLVLVPKPIYYGRKMEPIAIRRYESEMKSVIGKTVSVNKCGFIIYPSKCWLVQLQMATLWKIRVKIRMVLLKLSVQACQDRSFFREMVDSKMQLKTTHIYYHQVQLQIYVGAALYNWCDF